MTPLDDDFLPSPGALYRHRKSGRYYHVLLNARLEATQETVTVYQHADGGMPWVRPTAEFGERFDYMPNGEIPGPAAARTEP